MSRAARGEDPDCIRGPGGGDAVDLHSDTGSGLAARRVGRVRPFPAGAIARADAGRPITGVPSGPTSPASVVEPVPRTCH